MTPDRQRRCAILVIDDVEETRLGIKRLLIASGYEVTAASDEEDAVFIATSHPPDLILLCLGLDAVQAFPVASRIRKRAQLSEELPVVVFYVLELREGAEVDAGYGVYLIRPENFDQIRGLIGRLLHKPEPRG